VQRRELAGTRLLPKLSIGQADAGQFVLHGVLVLVRGDLNDLRVLARASLVVITTCTTSGRCLTFAIAPRSPPRLAVSALSLDVTRVLPAMLPTVRETLGFPVRLLSASPDVDVSTTKAVRKLLFIPRSGSGPSGISYRVLVPAAQSRVGAIAKALGESAGPGHLAWLWPSLCQLAWRMVVWKPHLRRAKDNVLVVRTHGQGRVPDPVRVDLAGQAAAPWARRRSAGSTVRTTIRPSWSATSEMTRDGNPENTIPASLPISQRSIVPLHHQS
jgi:hypothetical protein